LQELFESYYKITMYCTLETVDSLLYSGSSVMKIQWKTKPRKFKKPIFFYMNI